MGYVLDENKIRLCLSKTFKNVRFYLGNNNVAVSNLKIERSEFLIERDSIYRVSGMAMVSIVKDDGEYEELYSYSTKIKVNKEDEIEDCEDVYLSK